MLKKYFQLLVLSSILFLSFCVKHPVSLKPEVSTNKKEPDIQMYVIKNTVPAKTKGLDCDSFLFIQKTGNFSLPLIVDAWGTGLYTRSQINFSNVIEILAREGKMNVLTIEKPGISYDPESKHPDPDSKIAMNFEKFRNHTQEDLVTCTINALANTLKSHANTQPSTIIFKGHSEGVEVLTRAYLKLLESNNSISTQISRLIFSGVPMTGWKESEDEQLTTFLPKGLSEKVMVQKNKAISESDDVYLLPFGGVPARYYRTIFKEKSIKEDFVKIGKMNSKAKFFFFQGEKDINTLAKDVHTFELENQLRKTNGEPHLDLTVKYYDAAHSLGRIADKDMIEAFDVLK